MTIYGAGLVPAGTGPAGLWYDDDLPEGRPDPSTLSLAYDVASRGWTYDATTRQMTQMGGVLQRVALTLVTALNSSSVLNEWGIKTPRVHTENFAEEREQMVRDALRTMTDSERVVRIDSIVTEVEGSRSRTSVTVADLTTGTTLPKVTF